MRRNSWGRNSPPRLFTSHLTEPAQLSRAGLCVRVNLSDARSEFGVAGEIANRSSVAHNLLKSLRDPIWPVLAGRMSVPRVTIVTFIACIVLNNLAFGQWIGKQTGCYADSIVANPNRPTVTNPAHVTQYGVLELEYGADRFWPEAGIQQTSFGGLLKFGMLCDIELRWNTTTLFSETDASGTHHTFGDNWLGAEVRLHRQTRRLPTMAFSYAFKIPSASTEHGLGTGRVDHSVTFALSESIAHFNLDFNVTEFLVGRPSASGFDQNQQLALAVSRVIHGRLQFAGEFYGATQLNKAIPAYASSLWALTYTVVPRLVLDGGFEAGLTQGGPHRHAFVGATYSLANLYRALRKHATSR